MHVAPADAVCFAAPVAFDVGCTFDLAAIITYAMNDWQAITAQRDALLEVCKAAYELLAGLSKDFLKLVGLAFVIAAPFTWWMMDRWLRDFAYRSPISWWIFPAAAILALLGKVDVYGLAMG